MESETRGRDKTELSRGLGTSGPCSRCWTLTTEVGRRRSEGGSGQLSGGRGGQVGPAKLRPEAGATLRLLQA
eukprot:2268118-Rhodomonas_salina.2